MKGSGSGRREGHMGCWPLCGSHAIAPLPPRPHPPHTHTPPPVGNPLSRQIAYRKLSGVKTASNVASADEMAAALVAEEEEAKKKEAEQKQVCMRSVYACTPHTHAQPLHWCSHACTCTRNPTTTCSPAPTTSRGVLLACGPWCGQWMSSATALPFGESHAATRCHARWHTTPCDVSTGRRCSQRPTNLLLSLVL